MRFWLCNPNPDAESRLMRHSLQMYGSDSASQLSCQIEGYSFVRVGQDERELVSAMLVNAAVAVHARLDSIENRRQHETIYVTLSLRRVERFEIVYIRVGNGQRATT